MYQLSHQAWRCAGVKNTPAVGSRSLVSLVRNRVDSGFSMVELMIVVAIIAILVALAFPSYVNYITKTNRKAAEGCLSEYANYMERYYTTNLKYSGLTSLTSVSMDCAATSQTGNNYSYRFPAAPTTTAYTLQAVPINAQATRDTLCGTLTLTQAGTRGVSGSNTVQQCWQ